MTTSPYDRAARDALAREIYVNALASASNLGQMTPGEQEGLFDMVADIALLAANRFQTKAWATPLAPIR